MTQGVAYLFHVPYALQSSYDKYVQKNTVKVIIYGILWDETSAYRAWGAQRCSVVHPDAMIRVFCSGYVPIYPLLPYTPLA